MKAWGVVGWLGVAAWIGTGWAESRYEEFPVLPLSAPITVDGELGDWVVQGRGVGRMLLLTDSEWQQDSPKEAVEDDESPGRQLRISTGHREGRFYLAAQWVDDTQNAIYKPWKLTQGSYQRTRAVDDLFVVRFQLGESFNQCMLSNTQYRTDVWRWSAGRSNLSGIADDMSHVFANKPFDKPSREYEGSKGTVYFLNALDAGHVGWQTVPQPKSGAGPVVPSIVKAGEPSGSRADVTAVGKWKEGVWTLEMSRALKTQDAEDVVFVMGGENVMQFAVFNAGYQLRKFITKPVMLRFLDQGKEGY